MSDGMRVRAYVEDDRAPRPIILQTTHHDTPLTVSETRLLVGYLSDLISGVEGALSRTTAFTMPIGDS